VRLSTLSPLPDKSNKSNIQLFSPPPPIFHNNIKKRRKLLYFDKLTEPPRSSLNKKKHSRSVCTVPLSVPQPYFCLFIYSLLVRSNQFFKTTISLKLLLFSSKTKKILQKKTNKNTLFLIFNNIQNNTLGNLPRTFSLYLFYTEFIQETNFNQTKKSSL
jgi:hypothetical protein